MFCRKHYVVPTVRGAYSERWKSSELRMGPSEELLWTRKWSLG